MADTKVIDLTADATPTSDDLIYVSGDPTGSPVDRKVTLANVPVAWGTTATKVGYTSDVTSAIQAQLSGKQASDAELTAIAGLTFADVSIIELTGASTAAVVTSGGGGRLLGSNSGNTALEFKSSITGITIGGLTASKNVLSDVSGNLIASTSSVADTFAMGTILHASAANTVTGLATGATTDILVGGGAAAPVWTAATGTGAPVRADSPTLVDDVSIGAAGVKLTGANGALTILGLGDGADEDVKIDLNTTANTIIFSSPASSATDVSFSALHLATTGIISGKIGVISKGAAYTLGTDSAKELYGYMVIATAAMTLTLPNIDAANGVGQSVCIYSTGANVIRVNPGDADKIRLNGTLGAAGVDIYSAGAAGNFICLVVTDFATDVAHWTTLGSSGTWTVGT